MVKTFESPEISNITRSQLDIKPGEFSGDLIKSGTIQDFSSVGIRDLSSKFSLIVRDDRIEVKEIQTDTLKGNVQVEGNLRVFGTIEAGAIRAFEMTTISNQRTEKQFLEFDPPSGDVIGTGFLWKGGDYAKQFIFKNNPNRFFSSENLDLSNDKSLMIGGEVVISASQLGSNITTSNLTQVGNLRKLTVAGRVNIADNVFYNPDSERFSIGTSEANGLLTVYDHVHDVELIISASDRPRGVIGTYNNKGLSIVTDNQQRIDIEPSGDITLGQEGRDGTQTRVYGKLSIGVKNPTEQFEVAGNMRWGNRLFANGDGPPTSGSYQVGDMVWNSRPKTNAPIGWVCIVGGVPGQWRSFGTIN
jgi:hypothetical protein